MGNLTHIRINGTMAEFERHVDNHKEELEIINKRLKIAYDYKDHLYNAMGLADKNISDLQNEFFEKQNSLLSAVGKVKEAFDKYLLELSS